MKLKSLTVWVLLFLALVGGIVLTLSGALGNMDRVNVDMYHVLAGVRRQPQHTLIGSLDAAALQCYPHTPLAFWGPHFAKAINRLREAGASVIALDLYLAITPEQWLRTLDKGRAMPPEILDYDQEFDQALSEGGVLLAANPVSDGRGMPVPLPADEYLAALPGHLEDVGLTLLLRDSDAKIRRMVPGFEGVVVPLSGDEVAMPSGYQTPNPWWTFAALAVTKGHGVHALTTFYANEPFAPRSIDYCGPPKTIPRLSLATLFRNEELTREERAMIAGRIVFIGADNENFGDHHPTPYSQHVWGVNHRDMSGVEIHANIVETILNPDPIKPVPVWGVVFLWGMIMIAAQYLCTLHVRPLAIYISKLCSILLLWPIGFMLFKFGYIFPQSGIMISITMFFMLNGLVQLLGTFKFTGKLIGPFVFDKLYHERRNRRKTDPKIL